MVTFKVTVTHENETAIAFHCAKNNIEFNTANAFDIVFDTFKTKPITYKTFDSQTGQEIVHTVTERVARQIECQPRTIERIAEKAKLAKKELEQKNHEKNIKKAEISSVPDIDKLIENLYRLNIVDGDSYMALVCFLMQLKYTRNHDIIENDKTCVFFNGIARNGKSATAKAICDVEAAYGKVFKAQSGKLLESPHEEQVWASHINYFDEVKPTDIDRELLLNIVNGGEIEVNPKNKPHYNQHVNTNNIFTSNDQINLMQRRVSIIKFGDRLNGRPLGEGTLKKVVEKIMDSLPSFDHYYDLYQVVSIHNETRINPVAIESILTYASEKLGFVNESDERSLTATIIFAPHDIYNCYKNTYKKQIITSERRDAIKLVLSYLSQKNIIEEVEYKNCTTKNYRLTGENYIKLSYMYGALNTKDEQNTKISKTELYTLLAPYFSDKTFDDAAINEELNPQPLFYQNIFSRDSSLIKLADDATYQVLKSTPKIPNSITADVKEKGTKLFHTLLKQLEGIKDGIEEKGIPFGDICNTDQLLEKCITKELCKYISYEALLETLKFYDKPDFNDSHAQKLKEIYMRNLGYTDEKTLEIADEHKLSEIPSGLPAGMTIEDQYSFIKRINERERMERKEYKRQKEKSQKEKKILAENKVDSKEEKTVE